jgi:hypothetical protein
MKRSLIMAAIAMLLAGCAPVSTKSINAAQDLQGKKLIVTNHSIPDFSAGTAGKAMFGLVGGLAMISSGNELVRTDEIPDPAVRIGNQLANDLAQNQGVILVPSSGLVAPSGGSADLLKTYPGADLWLDVKTYAWSYMYYPTKWATYHVFYAANIRLVDGKTGDVIAQQTCKTDPVDPNNAPSLDELRANQGALLKKLFVQAADTCVSNAEQQILNLASHYRASAPQVAETHSIATPVNTIYTAQPTPAEASASPQASAEPVTQVASISSSTSKTDAGVLPLAQNVATQMGCGTVQPNGDSTFVASCGTYSVVIGCDGGQCRPMHTVNVKKDE